MEGRENEVQGERHRTKSAKSETGRSEDNGLELNREAKTV